ncbi:flagellar hook-associated protein FlgL [Acidocella aquatica]|uniref:Flagellar hook-associated protein FlgL n=1 Tax=Acidocella aquatica TaxID=1922313 RepID=A0ABQ6A778_9PROT|nr:flagellar hook-associated protein FlgL [Acidocella aquatica]GLR67508.1 flagellar hook-associated protein FlgL [Acidocella aquatica]
MNLSFYTSFNTSLAQQEAQINTLQQQISTGLAVQTPDQNPAAYQSAALGADQISALANNSNTQAAIQVQLGSVSNAYQATSSLLNSVQSVVEQALNGATSPQNLNALAGQVQSAAHQMLALGNTTASNGSYLFGGSRGSVAPFQVSSGGSVIYMGDGAQSQAAITPNTNASTIANGEVFVSGLAGDGTASVTAASTNAGTGQIISQGIANAASASAFQSGTSAITVSFGAGGAYTASQGGSTVASGTLTSNTTTGANTVQLGGVDYQLTGTPAAGDSFTLSPSRPQSAFTLLQTIYKALSTAGTTPSQVAQTNQVLNQSLAGLAQYQQNVVTAQAQNGVTLQAISNAATSNTNQSTQLQTSVQNATAVNTPLAITTLDQTLTALQAAMKTFGTVQSLSLFNYV